MIKKKKEVSKLSTKTSRVEENGTKKKHKGNWTKDTALKKTPSERAFG